MSFVEYQEPMLTSYEKVICSFSVIDDSWSANKKMAMGVLKDLPSTIPFLKLVEHMLAIA